MAGVEGARKAVPVLLTTDPCAGDSATTALNAATGSRMGESLEREEMPDDMWLVWVLPNWVEELGRLPP